MSQHTETSFFCKRCRASQVKRCRCPLPSVAQCHDWDADAAYNLWPDALKVPAAVAPRWDGSTIRFQELLDRSRT